MNVVDIILLCGIGVAVFFAVKHIVKQKKRCKQVGCANCYRAGQCVHQKKKNSR